MKVKHGARKNISRLRWGDSWLISHDKHRLCQDMVFLASHLQSIRLLVMTDLVSPECVSCLVSRLVSLHTGVCQHQTHEGDAAEVDAFFLEQTGFIK